VPVNRRSFVTLAAAAFLLVPGWSAAQDAAGRRPNVILFLADDLGFNGLRCYGSDLHETPNLDRLAAEGMRFTDAYSACTVCSPTRASVMTGKYPARLHLTDFISGQKRPYAKLRVPDWTMHLEHGEVTLAEALHAAGYATAHLGKWHLGNEPYYPEHQGFDVNVAGGPSPGGYFLPNRLPLPGAKKGDYLTDRLTDEAIGLIEQWQDRPFFLYFAFFVVHTPIQGKPDLVAHYEDKLKPGLMHHNPTYAAMAHSMDQGVGRIMEKLDALGLAKDTVIVFASDNGGLTDRMGQPTGFTDNAPLRRGKGSAYEGGVRVPLIVRWPGATQPGSVSPEPVATIDFYPTILDITEAAGDPAHNSEVDGRSLVPLLRGEAEQLDRDALYWHYPHYHAGADQEGPYGAVRARDWRLIEFYEDMRVELYNLRDDIGETRDLAGEEPRRVEELRGMLHSWRQSVGAQMPTPNPDYEPTRR